MNFDSASAFSNAAVVSWNDPEASRIRSNIPCSSAAKAWPNPRKKAARVKIGKALQQFKLHWSSPPCVYAILGFPLGIVLTNFIVRKPYEFNLGSGHGIAMLAPKMCGAPF
jgi:hypothetical protein